MANCDEVSSHSMMQITTTPFLSCCCLIGLRLPPLLHASHELHTLSSTYRQQRLHMTVDAPLGDTLLHYRPPLPRMGRSSRAQASRWQTLRVSTSYVLMHTAL